MITKLINRQVLIRGTRIDPVWHSSMVLREASGSASGLMRASGPTGSLDRFRRIVARHVSERSFGSVVAAGAVGIHRYRAATNAATNAVTNAATSAATNAVTNAVTNAATNAAPRRKRGGEVAPDAGVPSERFRGLFPGGDIGTHYHLVI